MPKPRRRESKNDYISRAVKHMMEFEGLRQKHAVGKAYGMWESSKKKKKRGK